MGLCGLPDAQVYERVVTHARAGHFMGGSCFWCLTAAGYPDYDGFKVSFQQPGSQSSYWAEPKQEAGQRAGTSMPGAGEKSSAPMQQEQGTDFLHNSASNSEAAPGKHTRQSSIRATEPSRDPRTEPASLFGSSSTPGADNAASAICRPAPASTHGAQHLSSSIMLRRVSSRTEGNVEAAAALVDQEGAQCELQAACLGAETVLLIKQHAAAMHELSQQAASKGCHVM